MVQSPLLDDARGGRYEHNQHLVSKNYVWSQQIRDNDTLRRLTNFSSGLSIFQYALDKTSALQYLRSALHLAQLHAYQIILHIQCTKEEDA